MIGSQNSLPVLVWWQGLKSVPGLLTERGLIRDFLPSRFYWSHSWNSGHIIVVLVKPKGIMAREWKPWEGCIATELLSCKPWAAASQRWVSKGVSYGMSQLNCNKIGWYDQKACQAIVDICRAGWPQVAVWMRPTIPLSTLKKPLGLKLQICTDSTIASRPGFLMSTWCKCFYRYRIWSHEN